MKDLEERKKEALRRMVYSIGRIDLLTISISGAGIYVCLESMKYLTDNCIQIHNIVRISGGLFLFAIISNFFSQFFGWKSNQHDYLMSDAKVKAVQNGTKEDSLNDIPIVKKHDARATIFDNCVKWSNSISTLLMLAGLSMLMYYFLLIF